MPTASVDSSNTSAAALCGCCRPHTDAATACAAARQMPALQFLSLAGLPLPTYDASTDGGTATLAPLSRCERLRRLHITAWPTAALPGVCTLTQLTAIRLRGGRGGGASEEEAPEEYAGRLPAAFGVSEAALLGLQVRRRTPRLACPCVSADSRAC